jgi:hypothetical protein
MQKMYFCIIRIIQGLSDQVKKFRYCEIKIRFIVKFPRIPENFHMFQIKL